VLYPAKGWSSTIAFDRIALTPLLVLAVDFLTETDAELVFCGAG
jgi:hypothetical protein